MAKGRAAALTRNLVTELTPYKIRVNARLSGRTNERCGPARIGVPSADLVCYV